MVMQDYLVTLELDDRALDDAQGNYFDVDVVAMVVGPSLLEGCRGEALRAWEGDSAGDIASALDMAARAAREGGRCPAVEPPFPWGMRSGMERMPVIIQENVFNK